MKNMKALVTGGNSGIGLEIARQLVDKGCTTFILGRDQEKLDREASGLGPLCRGLQCDLSSQKGHTEILQRLAKELDGSLDFLVHSAGVYHHNTVLEETPESVEEAFFTNFFSALSLAKGLYPQIKAGEGKSILFISSTLSHKPISGTSIYSASKAALDSLVSSLAIEWADVGIRVNSILPGVVDTPIHEPKFESGLTRQEKMRQFSSLQPLGRVGDVFDIARTALFILSPESSWITGVKWPVDGGISLV